MKYLLIAVSSGLLLYYLSVNPFPTLWVIIGIGVTDLLLSCLSFILYGWDKSAAKQGKRRIPERRLLLSTLLGGWLGSLLAQGVFRHKTKKTSFKRKFFLCTLLNITYTGLLITMTIPALTKPIIAVLSSTLSLYLH